MTYGGNVFRSLIGNIKMCKECIYWHIRNLSLDFSINEFIQNYAFDSHSPPNINLIDLTLTYTHVLFVFDIGTLLVLWWHSSYKLMVNYLILCQNFVEKLFFPSMRIEISFLINATRVELPSGQTTIALEMHHFFVINDYISNLNNHILFEMEKT